jgi:hypothetical protein
MTNTSKVLQGRAQAELATLAAQIASIRKFRQKR